MICDKAIQQLWCTLFVQLLHNVVVEVRSASKQTIEECGGGREDIDPNIDVYDTSLPRFDDDTREEDAEGDLDGHHRH